MTRPRGNARYRTALFFTATLTVLVLLCASPVSATKEREKFDTEAHYIGYPGNIPIFSNFTSSQMEPGEVSSFGFRIANRYDARIDDITLDCEIYFQGRIDERNDVSDISDPPFFVSSRNQTLNLKLGTLATGNDTVEVREIIRSKSSTREGSYFVRFIMNFTYNTTRYTMKSRGHFSDEIWDEATTDTDDLDESGAIDLEVLGVDGLVPETSFGVRRNVAFWPVTVLGIMAGAAAGLTVLVYLVEEETYPQLNKRVEELRRKFNELWFSLKKSKGKS